MADHQQEIATAHRRVPVYPAITLIDGCPSVNGVKYQSWGDALRAKEGLVEWYWVDVFGAIVRPALGRMQS